MSWVDLAIGFGPIVAAVIIIFCKLFFFVRMPRLCSAGLHRYEHTHDVKHRDTELIDSCAACVCGKQRVEVFNLWGKKVRTFYPSLNNTDKTEKEKQ